MEAFISYDKYIVKETLSSGVGVPVSFDEEIAKRESCRRRNVESYNQWMLINIPDKSLFLDTEKSMKYQTSEVFQCLKSRDFIMTLFLSEARRLYVSMDSKLSNDEDKGDEAKRLFADFSEEKFNNVISLPSGLDLINFINERCRSHDLAKSSALLYAAGIKGTLYNDEKGQRLLMFNAAEDIEPIETRKEALPDSKLIL